MERISVYERDHRDAISTIPNSFDAPAVISPKLVNATPATPNSIPRIAPAPVSAPSTASSTAPALPAAPTVISTIPTFHPILRVSRCIWCDSPDHSRRSECSLFIHAMKSGNIRINKVGYVVLSSTGAELPPSFGRGGMKSVYDVFLPPTSDSNSNSTAAVSESWTPSKFVFDALPLSLALTIHRPFTLSPS
jgi:hypothetical protein